MSFDLYGQDKEGEKIHAGGSDNDDDDGFSLYDGIMNVSADTDPLLVTSPTLSHPSSLPNASDKPTKITAVTVPSHDDLPHLETVSFEAQPQSSSNVVPSCTKQSLESSTSSSPPPSSALYVGSLTWWTTDQQLQAFLEPPSHTGVDAGLGSGRETGSGLKLIHIYSDSVNGKSRGFAYVEFQDASKAAAALDRARGKELNGMPCDMSFVRHGKGMRSIQLAAAEIGKTIEVYPDDDEMGPPLFSGPGIPGTVGPNTAPHLNMAQFQARGIGRGGMLMGPGGMGAIQHHRGVPQMFPTANMMMMPIGRGRGFHQVGAPPLIVPLQHQMQPPIRGYPIQPTIYSHDPQGSSHPTLRTTNGSKRHRSRSSSRSTSRSRSRSSSRSRSKSRSRRGGSSSHHSSRSGNAGKRDREGRNWSERSRSDKEKKRKKSRSPLRAYKASSSSVASSHSKDTDRGRTNNDRKKNKYNRSKR